MTKGILSFGAYIPRRRLQRKAIADTHTWFAPGLKGQAKGERAFCNWDEDAVTMAVEASRDALIGRDRGHIANLRFASTTFPFLDRLHSGIVAGALSLGENVMAVDVSATQRAGTTALLEANGLLKDGKAIAGHYAEEDGQNGMTILYTLRDVDALDRVLAGEEDRALRISSPNFKRSSSTATPVCSPS